MTKRNERAAPAIVKWKGLTLRDVLILVQSGQLGLDTKLECPKCEGKGKVITQASQRMINLMFEDGHPAAATIKRDYEGCERCGATGAVDPSSIRLSFDPRL